MKDTWSTVSLSGKNLIAMEGKMKNFQKTEMEIVDQPNPAAWVPNLFDRLMLNRTKDGDWSKLMLALEVAGSHGADLS